MPRILAIKCRSCGSPINAAGRNVKGLPAELRPIVAGVLAADGHQYCVSCAPIRRYGRIEDTPITKVDAFVQSQADVPDTMTFVGPPEPVLVSWRAATCTKPASKLVWQLPNGSLYRGPKPTLDMDGNVVDAPRPTAAKKPRLTPMQREALAAMLAGDMSVDASPLLSLVRA